MSHKTSYFGSGSGNGARAEDPGEFNQRRRLEVINDAREAAREHIAAADAGLVDERGDSLVTAEQAFAVVRAYVDDLRWPIANAGGAIYTDAPLGEFRLEPPEELATLVNPNHRGRVPVEIDGSTKQASRVVGSPDVDPVVVPVVGLVPRGPSPPGEGDEDEPKDRAGISFVELPTTLEYSWPANVVLQNRGRAHHVEFSVESAVPLDVTRRAYSLCNRFLNDMGLDVRIGERDARQTDPF